MKLHYSFCILMIYSSVYFYSCKDATTQDVTFISDITEPYYTGFSFEDHLKVSGLSENELNGEHVRIMTISDIGMSNVLETSIEPIKYVLLSNEGMRGKEIDSFYLKLNHDFSGREICDSGKTQSVIFKVIAGELNRMAKSNSNRKMLFINSDLYEHSVLADFYSKETLAQLRQRPEEVSKLFLDKYPLLDLSGIEVYIIYQPVSFEDDEKFEIVSAFYQNLFESQGAVVHIQSNV